MKAVLLCCFAVAIVFAEEWSGEYNDNPNVFDSNGNYVYKIDNLQFSAQLQQSPWSDTYWPSSESGIAHRWQLQEANDFNYQLYTKAQLMNLSSSTLKSLSPAEKYDIYKGRYDYPTVNEEWQRTSPDDPGWEGLCHGWAPASLYWKEPNPCVVTNADGIKIPFGSSDVKALLTFYTAEYAEQNDPQQFVADRCNVDIQANPSQANTSACRDINAGSLHVILANQFTANEGFVYDRDRSIQVWNQPAFKFSSTVSKPGKCPASASANCAAGYSVTNKVTYGKEIYPTWAAYGTYPITETYQYVLETDSNGNIIGGEWQEFDRPDFMWKVQLDGSFTGYFSGLKAVYAASQGSSNKRAIEEEAMPTIRRMRNVEHLSSNSQTFGIPSYTPNTHRAWSINPKIAAKGIRIQFHNVDTEKFRDKVKIYEGAKGEGALIAVLHGKLENKEVIVNSPSAVVVFQADRTGSGNGFSATYTLF
jgi:hypothetical protein